MEPNTEQPVEQDPGFIAKLVALLRTAMQGPQSESLDDRAEHGKEVAQDAAVLLPDTVMPNEALAKEAKKRRMIDEILRQSR
jgi:hypothetical protein